MNVFERFGIDHLSPSTCNLFAASPAMFVLAKVFKKKTSVGAAAHRGTAVEKGIVYGLCKDASLSDCQSVAMNEFEILTRLCSDSRREKEENSIAAMVEHGLNELKPYGCPSATQGQITHTFEGVGVPFLGFFDLIWEDQGIIVDIKTTHSIPSRISTSHARQVALYIESFNKTNHRYEGRITYVSSKKAITYRLENAQKHLQALQNIALTIQNFLSVSDDPKKLASLVVPDIDTSFYFTDPITRQAAYEVWGI